MPRLCSSLFKILLVLGAIGALTACDDDTPPQLLPLSDQQVAVNESLVLSLAVKNPDGLALDFKVQAPPLPGFAEVTRISASPAGAEFRWTPLASQVGKHELVFSVHSAAGSHSTSCIIEVIPAQSAAPVFLRPGYGGTFDLARNPCVDFAIEIQDDDSEAVEIRPRKPLPAGAELSGVDGSLKRAKFSWCPTEEQVQRSLRWPIALEADDGDHVPPTPHDYLIVLRSQPKGNCPGEPPQVTITSPAADATVALPGGYPVEVLVTDDLGVRDPPILYYTLDPPDPDDPPESFPGQRLFQKGQGSNQWRAIIPPLDLPEGKSQKVFFVVSATDNDDLTGTACDHTTLSDLHTFFALGLSPDLKAANCDPCTASAQCASGICAADHGGRCLPACASGCSVGTCQSVATINGTATEACGDASLVCDGTVTVQCQNDAYEPNDTLGDATPFTQDSLTAVICQDDFDIFELSTTVDTLIHLSLSDFDHQRVDLDLALYTGDGTMIGISSSENDREELLICLAANAVVYPVVYAYDPEATGAYTLTQQRQTEACCINDAFEPDDTFELARLIAPDGDFEGTICPGDQDLLRFNLSAAAHLSAVLVFNNAETDLDLELYGPDFNLVAGSWNDGISEELEVPLWQSGTYYLRVFPYGSGWTTYVGNIELSPIAPCTTTQECPLGNVCHGDACRSSLCSTTAPCPTGHACTPSGPAVTTSFCAATCAINSECRQGEACKWFANGRGCGTTGTGQNGDPCGVHSDCGGQRACYGWQGGYCARQGCLSNADCEANTFCASIAGTPLCVRRCGGTEAPCRIAEGYQCTAIASLAGPLLEACIQP